MCGIPACVKFELHARLQNRTFRTSRNVGTPILNHTWWNDWLRAHNDKFVCDAECAARKQPSLLCAFLAFRHFSDSSFWWRLRHPTQVLLCRSINLPLMMHHWHSEDNQLPSIFLNFLLVCVCLGSPPRALPEAFQCPVQKWFKFGCMKPTLVVP